LRFETARDPLSDTGQTSTQGLSLANAATLARMLFLTPVTMMGYYCGEKPVRHLSVVRQSA